MYTTTKVAVDLVSALRRAVPEAEHAEVAVCPPFTVLADVGRVLRGSPIQLGAQDVYWEREGAYTGEISPQMLVDLGCRYVIVGHSERRRYFGETDETVARKIQAVLGYQMSPIVCVGEHLHEREGGETNEVVGRQIGAAIAELRLEDLRKVVVAYEPIWAIGTGRSARGEDANGVIAHIRGIIAARFPTAAPHIRILYGGSVTPNSIVEFSRQPEIDGALVGGASLDAAKFAAIVQAVSRSRP